MHSRNINLSLRAVSARSLDFHKALAHDQINALSADIMSMESCNNLPERFYQTAYLYSTDRSSCLEISTCSSWRFVESHVQGNRGVNVVNVSGEMIVT